MKKPVCSADDCKRESIVRDKELCSTHYYRWWKGLPVNAKTMYDRTPLERFSEKYVVLDIGCWEWSGHRQKQGYGTFSIDGEMVLAHRAAWVLTVGKIPEGMNVLHSCDNPPCVNVDHLFLGTQKDNIQDMISKGRDKLIGEKSSRTDLTEDDVRVIKKLLSVGRPHKAISSLFGVGVAAIGHISTGHTWSHV